MYCTCLLIPQPTEHTSVHNHRKLVETTVFYAMHTSVALKPIIVLEYLY